MNHIQWLCLAPARSSARAVGKTPSWASTNRCRWKGSLMPAYWLCGRRLESGWRLLARRQQPRQDVKQDHHRTGHQRHRDEDQADDGWVNAGVVGETGGDAHDLGVAAVDQETLVHLSFLALM